jgi:nitrate reductase alpha subunit
VPDRYVRASDFRQAGPGQQPRLEDRGLRRHGKVTLPNGAIGFRWGPDGRADQGQWNLEPRMPATATPSSSSCR